MYDNWIDNVFKENYQFVKVLKNTDKSQIMVYRHKTLGKYIVKRSVFGNSEVYSVLQGISHPNIVSIYDVIKGDYGATVLEEYINGQTVFDYLKDNLYTPNGVKQIVLELCNALEFLHSNRIIPKDIKPENVMIDNNGTVKLIDFDAARLYKPFQSRDTKMLGTPGYAAPEQYGLNQTDERSDIYSLGMLMNVMLTGEPPEKKLYNGKLKKVIVKCTQTIPDNRYQSVTKLKKYL